MTRRKLLLITAVVIGLLAIFGGGLYLANRELADKENRAEMERRERSSSTPEPVTETDNATPGAANSEPTPGRYIDYYDGVVAESDRTLIFFHAPWCPQCRMIDSDIKSQSSLPDDLTIAKLDYDSNQPLRQTYGVTLQTTFVLVDQDGTLLKKYVAYNEPNFAAIKANILDE